MSLGHRITHWSAQSSVQLGIESLQQWRLHGFSRQAGPGLIAVMVTAIFFSFFSTSLWQIRIFPAHFKTIVTSPASVLLHTKSGSAFSRTSLLDFPRLPHDTTTENMDQKEICFKTAWVTYTNIRTPANYSLIMGVILHVCRHYMEESNGIILYQQN